ncbi:MAG: DUF547 domain-containing protein [Gemmatimonadaceae bacterium]|nr:DUF547 domain-containing protein [Gemmatimonadaceae bacterium]
MTLPTLRRLTTSAALALAVSMPHDTLDAQVVDHGAFDRLLQTHVVNGLVNYDAFKASPEFSGYLRLLAATNPAPLPRAEQLAFWINAYNAYTIQLINVKGERESIRNVNKSLGFLKFKGPWSEAFAVVGGKTYTLDDIEQRIIRPTFREPRIHFALVCAAIGCPPLRSEAYTGARLEAQLHDQAVIFLTRSPSKNRVDVGNRTVYRSQVFSFSDYMNDFGGSESAVGRFIARYYPAGPEKALLESGEFSVVKTAYDWSLNSQANGRRLGLMR